MILVEHLPGGGVAVQRDLEGAGTEADTCAYETLAVRDPPPTPGGAEPGKPSMVRMISLKN